MNRKIAFLLLIPLFFSAQFVFAEYSVSESELIIPQFNFLPYFAAVDEESSIPDSLRNNEFYLESLRLNKLAQDTFEYGDYDASTGFAEEAIRYAQLSDEYVADQLITEAKRLLDWADSSNIAGRYPDNYRESKDYYEASLEAQSNEEWDEAISSATGAIRILAALEAGKAPAPSSTPTPASASLPSQYTVRSWGSTRDCLWNIAGYSWVYGDPWKWKVLYDANKSKLPNPNNPDIIEPGMVLDIPSIKGEAREGMWRP